MRILTFAEFFAEPHPDDEIRFVVYEPADLDRLIGWLEAGKRAARGYPPTP